MLDPLSALSVAAAATQFAEQGLNVVLKLHSLFTEMRDVPKTLSCLETDLKQQIEVARQIRHQILKMATALDTAAMDSLHEMLSDYSSKMLDLMGLLNSLVNGPQDWLVKKSWNAIRAIDKKKEILACCDQLARKKSLLSVWQGISTM